MNELERKLELAQMKEKTAVVCYEKLLQEAEKLKIEKEAFENLVSIGIQVSKNVRPFWPQVHSFQAKSSELEIKKYENRLAEENLRIVKLEEKLSDY